MGEVDYSVSQRAREVKFTGRLYYDNESMKNICFSLIAYISWKGSMERTYIVNILRIWHNVIKNITFFTKTKHWPSIVSSLQDCVNFKCDFIYCVTNFIQKYHSSIMASTRTEDSAFKLDVNITKLDDSSPVFFKIDGERFKEIQTLKLQVDTTYTISFEFRPSKEVR